MFLRLEAAYTEDRNYTKTEVIRQFLLADGVEEGLGFGWLFRDGSSMVMYVGQLVGLSVKNMK